MTLIIRRGRLTVEKWFSPTLRRRDAFGFVLYKQVPRDRGMLGFVKSPFHTILIDLTRDLPQILADFSATTRRGIRKAQEAGIVTEPSEIDEFVEFYNAFARQLGIAQIAASECRKYADHLFIMKAVYLGEPLAMRACLIDEGFKRARELKSGSTRLRSDDPAGQRMAGYANRLLHWSLIQSLKQQGCRYYDLGGCVLNSADSALANITRFKLEFSKNIVAENEFRSWPLYLRERIAGKLAKGPPRAD
jgi:hypothetical protein